MASGSVRVDALVASPPKYVYNFTTGNVTAWPYGSAVYMQYGRAADGAYAASGGAHAGSGTAGVGNNDTALYAGDAFAPSSRGGPGGYGSLGVAGGAGGGSLTIEFTGRFVNDGLVSARGGNALKGSAAGGGAGGSLSVDGNVLSGNGVFSTRGGHGSIDPASKYHGGAGAGGRVYISATVDAFTGHIDARGGFTLLTYLESPQAVIDRGLGNRTETYVTQQSWLCTNQVINVGAAGSVVRVDSRRTNVTYDIEVRSWSLNDIRASEVEYAGTRVDAEYSVAMANSLYLTTTLSGASKSSNDVFGKVYSEVTYIEINPSIAQQVSDHRYKVDLGNVTLLYGQAAIWLTANSADDMFALTINNLIASNDTAIFVSGNITLSINTYTIVGANDNNDGLFGDKDDLGSHFNASNYDLKLLNGAVVVTR
jgi:hypothetical protein